MITTMVLCASMLLTTDIPAEQQALAEPEMEVVDDTNAVAQPSQSEADESNATTQTADAVPPELEEKEVDGVTLAAIEANVVSYTNQERARYGLPALQVDKELMETAREHAAWMTRTQNMVHTSRPVAENIAMGQPHSSDVVQAWMNSPGHRANILSSAYRRIGVAAYRTQSGIIFWCQQFVR